MSKCKLQTACVWLLPLFQAFRSIQAWYLARGQLHIQDNVTNSLGQADFYPLNLVFEIQRRKHPRPRTSISAVRKAVSGASKGADWPGCIFPGAFSPPWWASDCHSSSGWVPAICAVAKQGLNAGFSSRPGHLPPSFTQHFQLQPSHS